MIECYMSVENVIDELSHGKTSNLHRRKQRRRSASQLISFAVTAKLISAFVLATRIVLSLFFLNPKFPASLAIFCACTGRFVSDLVGNHIVGFPTMRLRCCIR